MARGGARNRSGPQADPNSGRSDRRGYTLTALPSEGYDGEPPEFPLPDPTERELEAWTEAWSTPQACAWSISPWRWPIVGEYVRLKVRAESDMDLPAAFVGQLHRYRDQIGLTPAGLKENGWAIATDEVAEKATRREGENAGGDEAPRRRRLSAVNDA